MKIRMAQKITKLLHLSFLAGTCFLWAGLLMPTLLQAAPGITARYLQSQGTQLVIEINVGSSPPASAILIQHLPPGVHILNSQPEAKHYSEKKSKAKWLFRNLHPGRSTVSITLDRAVTKTEISAKIRFKAQQDGEMETIEVGK